MKRSFALLLVLLFAVLAVPQAQAITFGLKGGFNLANVKVSGEDVPDIRNLKGLTGGVFFSLGSGALSIQPEVLYSRRGAIMDVVIGDTSFEGKVMLDYIEVPVLLKLRIAQAGPAKPFVFGGPAYSYLLKAKQELTFEDGTVERDTTTEFYKRSEVAAVFGAGLDMDLAAVKLTVDARYHLGLTDIQVEMEGSAPVKNKGFSVMVGIGF